jgi:hypothetical protein
MRSKMRLIGSRYVLALIAAALAVLALVWATHRGTLAPGATAHQLRKRLHRPYGFTCHRIKNDGSITLAGVTYRCDAVDEATHPDRTDYFVATDRRRIKGLQPLG